MKNIYKFLTLVFVFVAIIGCEEDLVIFDNENGETLVAFGVSSIDLPITIDATGVIEVPVNVSTVSSSERTFAVSVVEDETTAPQGSYSVGSVTIPANAYNGTLTINGTDNNVETTPENLVIEFAEGSGFVTEGQLTVSVFQVCPVEETAFTGMYEISIVAPGVFGGGTYGAEGTVVDISASGLTRTFTANYFGDARFPRDFTFTLVCNEIVIARADQNVGCAGNTVNLVTGPPTGANGTYDATDDSSFTINITDNVDSDCGGSPVQASYIFTKV